MTLQRWDPFARMRRLDSPADRLWNSFFSPLGLTHSHDEMWNIPLDVFEKDGDLTVKASLPGIDPKDVHVQIEDGVLTVRAERKAEEDVEEAGYLMREQCSGSFYRALRLPETIDQDKVSSAYSNGVLTISLPKSEATRPRTVEVKVA